MQTSISCPSSTDIIVGLIVVAKQEPLPAEHRGRAMALLVDGNIKAVFAAGAVPLTVEPLLYSKFALQVERIETAVVLKWYVYSSVHENLHLQKEPQSSKGANFAPKLLRTCRSLWNDVCWQILISPRSAPSRTLSFNYYSLSRTFNDSRSKAVAAYYHLIHTTIKGLQLDPRIYLEDEIDGCTVKMHNLTNVITDDEALGALRPTLKPDRIISKEPDISTTVRRLTGQVPTITNPISLENGLGRQVDVVFRGSPRLDGVARKLDGQHVPEFGKLCAAERVSVWLYMTSEIYQRYHGLLKYCANKIYFRHKVQIHIYGGGRYGPTYVKVIGDRDGVMAAKVALDNELIHNMAGPFSPPPKPSNQTHRIVLSKKEDFIRATDHGGIARAKALLGDNVVHLDPWSAPPAIVVKGDTATLRKAQRELNLNRKFAQSTAPTCTICWEEAEDFVKVEECGDVACKDCFAQYCTVSRDSKFPLRCFQENCESTLQLHQIRSALGEDGFQRLASEPVEHYFKQRPDEYVKCPGPDCSSYSPTNKSEAHSCASCFTIFCQACKAEYHYGETCKEYMERTLGHMAKLQEWIVKEGAKRCPRCEGIVQKELGCDNVKCPLCKIDFCWACLKMFESHDAVYKHQIEAHGSYFADELELANEMQRLGFEQQEHRARVIVGPAAVFPQPRRPAEVGGAEVHRHDEPW